HNPSLDSALARMKEARANSWLEFAGLVPGGTANAEVKRSRSIVGFDSTGPITGVSKFKDRSLDAQWEIDLFGGQRRAFEAARRRAFAAESQWHDARTTLAAEVANTYTGLRACEARLQLQQSAAVSREGTADLVGRKASAGLASSAEAAQAAAAAADNRAAVRSVDAACRRASNALVYLTGLEPQALAAKLAPGHGTAPVPVPTSVSVLPAVLVRQRPDVAAAEAEWAAAVADYGFGIGELLPSVNLVGSLGRSNTSVFGESFSVDHWRFGPNITMPALSFGKAAAGLRVLSTRIDAARGRYENQVRVAIREVEDALVTLDAATARDADAARAAAGWSTALQAMEARHRAGLASTLELEEVRRLQLQAADARIALAQERTTAWVALYKALGGGWSATKE
ncbi:MAG: putative efflux pump outer membrane protein TtgC precursor, partial [Pseudomonadota bacterium]